MYTGNGVSRDFGRQWVGVLVVKSFENCAVGGCEAFEC